MRTHRPWSALGAAVALGLAILVADAPARAADSKEELQRKAETLHEELAARLRSHGAADDEVQRIRWDLGNTLRALGLPKKALEYHLPAESEYAKQLSPTDSFLVSLRCGIAGLWVEAGKGEEGLEFLSKWIEELPAPEERKDTGPRLELAGAMSSYGAALHGVHAYAESLAMYEGSYAIRRELRGDKDLLTIYSLQGACACRIELGRSSEARGPMEEILATVLAHHPEQAELLQNLRNNLAFLYTEIGEHGMALGMFDYTLEQLDLAGAPADDRLRLLAARNRAHALADLGRHAEAVAEADRWIETVEDLRPKSEWAEQLQGFRESRKEWKRRAAEAEKAKKPGRDAGKPPAQPAGEKSP